MTGLGGAAASLAGFTVAVTAVRQAGELTGMLVRRGADVLAAPALRLERPEDDTGPPAGPPDDPRPLDALLDGVLAGGVDAVTFTSAAAVSHVLARADARGIGADLLKRLCSDVLAVCDGPVTAAELTSRQVPTVQPERSRLGAMVRLLAVALQSRARRIEVAGNELEIRGHAVLVNGRLRPVPPSGMALLRVMGNRPGVVVPRQVLLRALPGGTHDEHAVEAAVARLRGALGEPRLIQTVVKRGYRLATDPRAGSRLRRLVGEATHPAATHPAARPAPGQADSGRDADRGRSAEEPPARIV